MAAKTKRARQAAGKAGDAADAVRSNPYVQRLIEDEDLRDDIQDAFESVKGAYGRMANGKGPAKALLDDKKVQRDLSDALDSLRDASDRLRGRRKKRRLGRLFVIAFAGAVLALVLSEGARKAVLDMVFGSEEEFEYTSATAPPTPASTTSP